MTKTAPTTVADAVAQLPSFRFSGPTATANGTGAGAGAAFLNLRGLGANRTLTLLDGRRFVPATGTGSVDVNLMPSALVERVDVVTGGASAAYGSDAVTGVVNFILKKNFNGYSADFQAGASDYWDNKELKGAFAAGTAFAGGRGHVEGSVEGFYSQGVPCRCDREFQRAGWDVITNPNPPPARLIVPDVRLSNQSWGGLVTSGPFKGVTFGPDGQATTFNYGALTGSNNQKGGDGPNNDTYGTLTAPVTRGAAFARVSWDLNPNVQLFGEASYGVERVLFTNGYAYASGSTALTIQQDNAFLPSSLASQMKALNVKTLTVGRLLGDAPQTLTLGRNATQRYVAGADFNWSGWKGEAYYEYGRVDNIQQVLSNLNQVNFYQAVDAVLGPSGKIVCRTTLTNPNNGCVPYDVIGVGRAAPEAIAYAFGTSTAHALTQEQAVAANVSGEPFSTWAGPVSVAAGAEFRDERFNQTSDPLSQTFNNVTNTIGVFRNANPQPQHGQFNVTEGFVETVIPLGRGMTLLKSLDFNGAVRETNYSTSGAVTSWKTGFTYEPVDGVRFRVTRSRDIRAPNLSELFLGGTQVYSSATDPVKAVFLGNIRSVSAGNPNLVPELADTLTYGLVYRPTWLSGFSVSVDAYKIDIAKAIASLSVQNVLNQCAAGSAAVCQYVHRDSTNNIISVDLVPLNLAAANASGIDFEAGYRVPLTDLYGHLPGALSLRGVASYVGKLSTTSPGAAPVDRAGDVGTGNGGLPRWKWTASANYDLAGWSSFVQLRYVGGGKFDNTVWANTLNIYNIPGRLYTDVRLAKDVRDGMQIYVSISNLFNVQPPVDPQNFNQAFATNNALYDVVGRMFRIGLTIRH